MDKAAKTVIKMGPNSGWKLLASWKLNDVFPNHICTINHEIDGTVQRLPSGLSSGLSLAIPDSWLKPLENSQDMLTQSPKSKQQSRETNRGNSNEERELSYHGSQGPGRKNGRQNRQATNGERYIQDDKVVRYKEECQPRCRLGGNCW